MNRTDKYDLILSWKDWLKNKPILKVLLIDCKNRNWKRSLQYIKIQKHRTSGAQILILHAIFYTIEGIEELSKYTDFIWKNTQRASLGMMQMLGHRYRDEDNFDRMAECYLKSALRAEKINDLKWGVSTYFYLASYAKDKLQAERFICILLEKYAKKVTPSWKDLYKHKIHRPAVWLACHVQTPQGEATLKKLPRHLILPPKSRHKILLEHYATIKQNQDCFLGRNGKVVQGPNDLKQNRHDPMWGWLNWYQTKVN